MKAKISFKIDKKTTRNTKYFSHNGKSYPFNFNLFKQNSDYFNKSRSFLKSINLLKLISEEEEKIIDISDNVIDCFIDCCEGESIDIDSSNVIPLQFLAYKYEVQQLINITTKFMSENGKDLAVKSLLFKTQIQSKDDTNLNFLNTSNEEKIISSNITKYIEEEKDLVNLPIPVLDRIFHSQKVINNSEPMINFLFACLDKHGEEASVLFSLVDFESQSIDVVNRLLKNYSEIFDFNMINSTLLKTTSQLTSELTKLKVEYSCALKEMKMLFENQRKELENISKQQVIKEKSDEIKRIEREKAFQNEMIKMNEERENRQRAFEEMVIKMEKKQEDIIQSHDIISYFKILRKVVNKESFNQLDDSLKKFLIEEIIQKDSLPDDAANDTHDDFYYRIRCMNKFLDLIQEKNKKYKIEQISNFTSSKSKRMDFILNNINKLFLNHEITEILFDENILKSIIIDFIKIYKDDFIVEIKYPSDNFLEIVKIVTGKEEKYNEEMKCVDDDFDDFDDIDDDEYPSDSEEKDVILSHYIKIALHVDANTVDNKLRKKNFICQIKFGSNTNKINNSAFYQCKNLSLVEFSSSITEIGNKAFDGCSKLENISIPASVTTIGENAFSSCSSLVEITIPSSVTSIKSLAFCDCSSLRRVTIQSVDISIGNKAFYRCYQLNEFDCDSSTKSIIQRTINDHKQKKLIKKKILKKPKLKDSDAS